MNTPNPQLSSSPVTRVERPAAAAAAGAETQVNPLLRLHLLLYGRYKWAVMLGLLLAVVGAVSAWFLMPPKYEVTGLVNIKPYTQSLLKHSDGDTGLLPAYDAFVSLQVSVLQGPRIQARASENPDWLALGQNSDRWGKKIPVDLLVLDHPKGSSYITVGFTDRNPSVAATAVRALLEAYKEITDKDNSLNGGDRMDGLVRLRNGYLDEIKIRTDKILALAKEYGSDDLGPQFQFKLEEQHQLETQLQQVEFDISLATAALTGAPTAPVPAAPATQTAVSTNQAMAAATQPGAASTSTAPATLSANPPAPDQVAPVRVAPVQAAPMLLTREDVARFDQQMREYLALESNLQSQLSQLRQTLGDSHRSVLAAQAALDAVEQSIGRLLVTWQAKDAAAPRTGVDGGGRVSLAELLARRSSIQALLEKKNAETKLLGNLNLQIHNLQEEKDGFSAKIKETSAAIDDLNVEASTSLSKRIEILNYGELPTVPLASKRIPLTVAMGLFGMALGVGLIALRGLADRRVSSLLHMQQLAPAIRVLGMLPVLPEDLSDPEQITLAAHCVHQIRNLLDAINVPDKGRVLAITSPSAGDGKTSLALALGLSFAASGSRTLLIDCDMVGGGLTRRLNAVTHRRIGSILLKQGLLTEQQVKEALRVAADGKKKFGEVLVELGYLTADNVQRALADQKETSVGLLDALNGDSVSACVSPVVMDGLSLLPLGEADSEHTSQISAKALRRVIKEARTQFDLILIDTGPVLGSLEASIAAREADEVILAIARGAPSPLVTRGVELLASVGARLGGIVFNRATPGDVAYSNYGSSGSLRSLKSSQSQRSAPEPRSPAGSPPRLGPVAAAVAASGTPDAERTPPTNGHANGSANGKSEPPAATANGKSRESSGS